MTFTAAENGNCTKLGREVEVKFISAISQRCDKINPKFLCVNVDTLYGYYQFRFSSFGPSYKGEIFYFRPNFDKLPNPVECKLYFLI